MAVTLSAPSPRLSPFKCQVRVEKNMKKGFFQKIKKEWFFSVVASDKKMQVSLEEWWKWRGAVALHNYHNAHENKRLMSQRTSKLMWCQLVSEADHSLPFQRKEKTERATERKKERDWGGKGVSKTIHSDFVEEKRQESKRVKKMKDRL